MNNPTIPNGTEVIPKRKNIYEMIAEQKKAFAMVLPAYIDIDRFMRRAEAIVKQNPALLQCTPSSVLGALYNAAESGLEAHLNGESYIIPRKVKGTMQACFQVGYKGLLKMFQYTYPKGTCFATTVYEGDDFFYELGLRPNIHHIPKGNKDRQPTHFYAVAFPDRDAQPVFAVWTYEDMIRHAEKIDIYKAGKRRKANGEEVYTPWFTHFTEMAEKTVMSDVLRMCALSAQPYVTYKEPVIRHFDTERDNSIENYNSIEVPQKTDYEEVSEPKVV